MAYPRDFFEEWSDDVDRALCFGIMPFDEAFDPVWSVIRDVAESDPINIRCLRADEVTQPGFIMEDVLEYIAQAGVIIADLTGRNPNVFYELGIAHSHRPSDSVVLLAQTLDDVPFDLRHLRCVVYNPDLTDLGERLHAVLTGAIDKRLSLALREGETENFPARLTGDDRAFYEVEVKADWLADDGAKVFFTLTRLVGGRDPEIAHQDGPLLLSKSEPPLPLPGLGWSLEYGGLRDDTVIVLLTKYGKEEPREDG